LNVLGIELPPLRDRRDDIPLLVQAYVEEVSERLKRDFPGISAEAMEMLTAYSWPGNVRELENEIERVVALSGGEELVATGMLSERVRRSVASDVPSSVEAGNGNPQASLSENVDALKRRLILAALHDAGSKAGAAKRLGVPRQSLQKMMKRLGLFPGDV